MEPEVYGSLTLEEVDRLIAERAGELDIEIEIAQSNLEGELVDLIQGADGRFDAILLNPGGYTHTSVAIRDAVAAVAVPAIEVHLSNPSAREPFRHADVVGGACRGVISGFGWRSYLVALEAVKGLDGGRGRI